jgi:hypothetical protein
MFFLLKYLVGTYSFQIEINKLMLEKRNTL